MYTSPHEHFTCFQIQTDDEIIQLLNNIHENYSSHLKWNFSIKPRGFKLRQHFRLYDYIFNEWIKKYNWEDVSLIFWIFSGL